MGARLATRGIAGLACLLPWGCALPIKSGYHFAKRMHHSCHDATHRPLLQVASRLVSAFSTFKNYDPARQVGAAFPVPSG